MSRPVEGHMATHRVEGPNDGASLTPGDAVGRYIVRGFLGQGGMGTVYRAHDTVLLRDVALKVVRVEAAGQGAIRRWMREAHAVAALSHPNIVSIFDMGQFAGMAFLAMELVPGESLRRLVAGRQTPLATRVSWLKSIASALAAAHESGIIHRDIKPENVIVRGDGLCKVLDFGLARWLDDRAPPEASDTRTQEGLIMGTPAYMAPEQLRGEPVDERVDQFAWGIVAFEVLTGQLPWNIDVGGYALAIEIITKSVPPIRELDPTLPAHFEAVVARALSKSPEDRFASMTDILEALSEGGGVERGVSPSLPVPEQTRPNLPPTVAITNPAAVSTFGSVVSEARPALAVRPVRRHWAVYAVPAIVVALGAGVKLWPRGADPTLPRATALAEDRQAPLRQDLTKAAVPVEAAAVTAAREPFESKNDASAPPSQTVPKPRKPEAPPHALSPATHPLVVPSKARPVATSNGAPILDPE